MTAFLRRAVFFFDAGFPAVAFLPVVFFRAFDGCAAGFFLAAFRADGFFFADAFFFRLSFVPAVFFRAVFFRAVFFRDAFFRDVFFRAAFPAAGFRRVADFFFADFFVAAFFFAAFFAGAFFLVTLAFLPADFRVVFRVVFLRDPAARAAAFRRVAPVFPRFLLAAFLAGIVDSCRSGKNAGLYIPWGHMEARFRGFAAPLRGPWGRPPAGLGRAVSSGGDNRVIAGITLHYADFMDLWPHTS